MPRPKTKENSFPVPRATARPLKVGAKIYTHIHCHRSYRKIIGHIIG